MDNVALSILCHYFACQGDYRDGDFNTPVTRAAIEYLRKEEMLVTGTQRIYDLSSRGHVFMEAVKNLPFPVATTKWVMP
jgi:hypothetical protein